MTDPALSREDANMRNQDWRNDPAPYVPGAKHHNLLNDDYWHAMFRVSYFRWAAGKSFVRRDPMTGRDDRSPVALRIEHKANLLSAHEWLNEAAALRNKMPDVFKVLAGR